MAIFGVVDANTYDEITQYQLGRYVSSNEAIWRIFSFAIHERHPTVTARCILHQELQREQQYNRVELNENVRNNVPKMNLQQQNVYNTIMTVINDGSGGIYFIDAPGGTGKTFLISIMLATIRSQGQIALALASSGIAATLLDGGRTAHSALKLPLNLQINENPTCNISKTSGMAKVLQQCTIIIWDECTMAHKTLLEALNRTMQDLRGNQNLFGGALILLAGDFRQTLPVISRSTVADEINACLKLSNLWWHVKTLKLTLNMCVQICFLRNCWILEMADFCNFTASKEELIQKVFPKIAQNYKNHVWLSERAILAPKNKDVNDLNKDIQNAIPGQTVLYKSVDTVMNQDEVVNYPTGFLNSLELSGLPPHELQLKVGSVIIMLRNINQPRPCNGTRLAVKKLMNNLIEATEDGKTF